MTTRTILVTGAAGFVSSHLLARLRSTGAARIAGFDRRIPASGAWDAFVNGDVTSRDSVLQLVRDVRPDEVYHLAGVTRGSDAKLKDVNVRGTRYLLEAIANHSPEATFIAVGSAAEYGRTAILHCPLTEKNRCEPVGGYGRTKHAATLETLAAASAGLRANVVRPFNLVGAGVPQSLVAGAIVSRLSDLANSGGRRLVMGNVDSLRDFLDVGDAVAGMVSLARSGLVGQVFNLCTGIPRSIRDLVLHFADIAGVDVEIVTDTTLATTEDIKISVGSHAAASAAFGFWPATPFSDSLKAAWAEHRTGVVTS